VNSNFGVQTQLSGKLMLCPCCGGEIVLGVEQCFCGARFVGSPLDESPIQVRRFGPAFTSAFLLLLVIGLTAIVTKWLAFSVVVPAWFAWRAIGLVRRDPKEFGGYRLAVASLSIALVGGSTLAAYGIGNISRALDNHRIRQIAATEAEFYHIMNQLDQYRRDNRSYPRNAQEMKKQIPGATPVDYWGNPIRYQGYTAALAYSGLESGLHSPNTHGAASIQVDDFELRSAGPDGIEGTDDDIIMRNGVLYTSAEIKKMPFIQMSSDR
jgi:hypothetical protein